MGPSGHRRIGWNSGAQRAALAGPWHCWCSSCCSAPTACPDDGGSRLLHAARGLAHARLKAVCQLVEKAFLGGERVFVWLQDETQQAGFDDLLWTFGDRAFVPHETLASDPAACEAPVQLFAGARLPEAVKSGGFSTLFTLREDRQCRCADLRSRGRGGGRGPRGAHRRPRVYPFLPRARRRFNHHELNDQ